jgi:hypothetical protein
MLDAHLRLAHRGCVGAQRCTGFAIMAVAVEARN